MAWDLSWGSRERPRACLTVRHEGSSQLETKGGCGCAPPSALAILIDRLNPYCVISERWTCLSLLPSYLSSRPSFPPLPNSPSCSLLDRSTLGHRRISKLQPKNRRLSRSTRKNTSISTTLYNTSIHKHQKSNQFTNAFSFTFIQKAATCSSPAAEIASAFPSLLRICVQYFSLLFKVALLGHQRLLFIYPNINSWRRQLDGWYLLIKRRKEKYWCIFFKGKSLVDTSTLVDK